MALTYHYRVHCGLLAQLHIGYRSSLFADTFRFDSQICPQIPVIDGKFQRRTSPARRSEKHSVSDGSVRTDTVPKMAQFDRPTPSRDLIPYGQPGNQQWGISSIGQGTPLTDHVFVKEQNPSPSHVVWSEWLQTISDELTSREAAGYLYFHANNIMPKCKRSTRVILKMSHIGCFFFF